jgi:RNA polymerase sigma-70 factor (ECF subfamily)
MNELDDGLDDVFSDAELLERARRGDEDAFSQLFGRHQGAICRYAVHMCGPEAGDDIVQETFLVVLRQRGRTDAPRSTVAGYLFGIARHLVLQRLGSKYEPPFTDAGDEDVSRVASDALTALDDLTRAETIATVRAAVQSLPPVYREVVVLCELQDMDYAAAAGVVQCPIGTIRSRLARARSLLAAKLGGLRSAASRRQA